MAELLKFPMPNQANLPCGLIDQIQLVFVVHQTKSDAIERRVKQDVRVVGQTRVEPRNAMLFWNMHEHRTLDQVCVVEFAKIVQFNTLFDIHEVTVPTLFPWRATAQMVDFATQTTLVGRHTLLLRLKEQTTCKTWFALHWFLERWWLFSKKKKIKNIYGRNYKRKKSFCHIFLTNFLLFLKKKKTMLCNNRLLCLAIRLNDHRLISILLTKEPINRKHLHLAHLFGDRLTKRMFNMV